MHKRIAHWRRPAGAHTRRRSYGVVAVALSVVLGASACGGSTGGTSTGVSSASGTNAKGVAEAKAALKKLEEAKFTIPPLSKQPPTGKTLAFVNCSLPSCNPGKMKIPAAALGWTVKEFLFDFAKGPQGYTAAIDAALASKPDYLVVNQNYPDDVDMAQLKQADAAGIPVFLTSGTDAPPYTKSNALGTAAYEKFGAVQAQEVLALAGGPVEVLDPIDPTLPTFVAASNGFKNELTRLSPQSKVDVLNVSLADPQTTIVTQQTNYLRAHPNVKFVTYPGGTALYGGVGSALKSSGLASGVTVVTGSITNQADIQPIANGDVKAGIAMLSDYQWYELDNVARFSVGDQFDRLPPIPWFNIVTKKNATVAALNPPNFQEVYKQAWKVG